MIVILPSFRMFLALKRSPLKFSKELLCLLEALLVVVRVRDLPLPELREVLVLEPEFLFSLGAFGTFGAFGLDAEVVVLAVGLDDFPLLYAGVDAAVVVLVSPRTINGCLPFDLGAAIVVVLPTLVLRPLYRLPGLAFWVVGSSVCSGSGRRVVVVLVTGLRKFVYFLLP